MPVPHSIIGFTEASDTLLLQIWPMCLPHCYFELSNWSSRCCLKTYHCSEVEILSMEPPFPVPHHWLINTPRPFFCYSFLSILKDHSSQRTSEVHQAPSIHLRVLLGLPCSKMLELGVFKVTPSWCRNLPLCMWCPWKQMKQRAEDKPLKGC